jgi:hypothetical protein
LRKSLSSRAGSRGVFNSGTSLFRGIKSRLEVRVGSISDKNENKTGQTGHSWQTCDFAADMRHN